MNIKQDRPLQKTMACFLKEIPVHRDQEVEADIVGIGTDGEGVGKYNGFTLFIPGALPGERVLAKVLKLKKQYGFARLIQVMGVSPERVDAPCAIFSRCGGCQLQHLSYEAQLRWKQQLVKDALERIGGLSIEDKGITVRPVIGMTEPWRYRNKVQIPVGVDGAGDVMTGFYAAGSHEIIEMSHCLIQHEAIDQAMNVVRGVAQELGIAPYDAATHEGELRHVVFKYGYHTDELMIVLVTRKRHFPSVKEFVERIRSQLPEVHSIWQNVNEERTSLVLGEQMIKLWGNEVIYEMIGSVRYAISARSFFQVNPVQTKPLYETVLAYAGLTGKEVVIDAYCGIGTISLYLARHARRVLGVELLPDAVADARANARLNGIANADFVVGRAEAVLPAWRAEGIDADVIVVDPPRKGCEAALLEALVAMRPQRIVYVSCNPATLARDLAVLEVGGFRTVEVQPVDMFPHTTHVECVVLMSRA
jgi:23S rRNA (uracil1939-C5)-methyltransferase